MGPIGRDGNIKRPVATSDDDRDLFDEVISKRWPGRYILEGRVVKAAPSLKTWLQWMATGERRIAKTLINEGTSEEALVSTVFLGMTQHLDEQNPPDLFETMIFRKGEGGQCWRYGTWEEAKAAHDEIVEGIRNANRDFEEFLP
jgi:hypothetical protein